MPVMTMEAIDDLLIDSNAEPEITAFLNSNVPPKDTFSVPGATTPLYHIQRSKPIRFDSIRHDPFDLAWNFRIPSKNDDSKMPSTIKANSTVLIWSLHLWHAAEIFEKSNIH